MRLVTNGWLVMWLGNEAGDNEAGDKWLGVRLVMWPGNEAGDNEAGDKWLGSEAGDVVWERGCWQTAWE